MTTNAAPITAHAHCSHPVTKQARAICRRQRGAAYASSIAARATAKPRPKLVIETCCCKGKPSGFTANALGVWVCVDCDRPKPDYAKNVLNAA
jgi:hypothetical protein